MSENEVQAINTKLDRLISEVAKLSARSDVIEARQRPDKECMAWVEERYIRMDQFSGMHQEDHDNSRRRTLTIGQIVITAVSVIALITSLGNALVQMGVIGG